IQIKREPVFRAHRDGRKFLIELMGFGPRRRPVQHDISSWYQLDLHDASVQRMFSWIQRLIPHTLAAAADDVTVREFYAGDIAQFVADKSDSHTHMADRLFYQVVPLNPTNPGVNVVRTRQDDLFLQTAAAAVPDERLRVLEVVVSRHDLRCHLP